MIRPTRKPAQPEEGGGGKSAGWGGGLGQGLSCLGLVLSVLVSGSWIRTAKQVHIVSGNELVMHRLSGAYV